MAKIPIYYIKTIEGYYAGECNTEYKESKPADYMHFDGGRSSSFFGCARSGMSGVPVYNFTPDKNKAQSCVISGLGEVITQIAYRQNKGYIPKSNIEIIREEK